MEFKTEASGRGILILDGELTIDQAAKIRELLIIAFESAKRVDICLRDVTAIDISCLQLLCSAHRTAVKAHLHVVLDDGNSEIFRQTVRNAGFFRSRDCQKDPYGNCFWTGGDAV